MRYLNLLIILLLITSSAYSKKHLLTYKIEDGTTIMYQRTDSIRSTMLIGGLANNIETSLHTKISITCISHEENENINLNLVFEDLNFSETFNGQSIINVSDEGKAKNNKSTIIQKQLILLSKLSFPFALSSSGKIVKLPNLNKICDSLNIKSKDKKTLNQILDQAYLERIFNQCFPQLPVEKVKSVSQWEEKSTGCINIPYSLSISKQLNILDKTSFSMKGKGSHIEEEKATMTFGNTSLEVTINAAESENRTCSILNGLTQSLQYNTTINGRLKGQLDKKVTPIPPIEYKVKTLLLLQ